MFTVLYQRTKYRDAGLIENLTSHNDHLNTVIDTRWRDKCMLLIEWRFVLRLHWRRLYYHTRLFEWCPRLR